MKKICSIKIFLDYFNTPGKPNIFRGQTKYDDGWKLIPELGIKAEKLEESKLLNIEQKIFNEFKIKSKKIVAQINNKEDDVTQCTDDFDRIVLGRHHRLYARVIDWTHNANVALYFAVNKDFERDGVIWMIKMDSKSCCDLIIPNLSTFRHENNPFFLNKIRFFHPKPFLCGRSDQQSALVSIHNQPLIDMQTIPPFDKVLEKILISKDAKKDMLAWLDKRGFTRGELYSEQYKGLDAICDECNRILVERN